MLLMTIHTPIIVCWSPKGGSGTSVTAAVLALLISKSTETVLIDADGDQAPIFGLGRGEVGFGDWARSERNPASLRRLTLPLARRLRLVDSGADIRMDAAISAAMLRDAFPESTIVIDAGASNARYLVEAADHVLCVVRPCYLSAQRLLASSVRHDGIVFVDEPGRVLRAKDIAEVVATPIVSTIDLDPALARLIDAGRIRSRLPRSTRPLSNLADQLLQEFRRNVV